MNQVTDHNDKSLLKFITCGSVDDGKSTLIGHILYHSKLIFADQKKALELESAIGSSAGEINFSLLLDGLMAEREQGITIDVAYRFFATQKRSFIVADTPGHEQYTRNMAVGASFADLAIILVDATKGILIQTKRHIRICSLMGIKHFVLAVNKMDLVDYDEAVFNEIKQSFIDFSAAFHCESAIVMPVSATNGDNLIEKSANTPWYGQSPLLNYLENVNIQVSPQKTSFVMPIQRVCRPNSFFRGFQGQIESGCLSVGQTVSVLPSAEQAVVKDIHVMNKMAMTASSGQAITVQLDREIDISRGDVLVGDSEIEVANMFSASILWMDENALVEGRNYLLKNGTKVLPATVMRLKYKIDINTGKQLLADKIVKNELAMCDIALSGNLVFDSFKNNKALGSFILIDRLSKMTAGCGVIEHPLRRSQNVIWQDYGVKRQFRAEQKMQKPFTIWFTGLSGSGKSTLANEVEQRLVAMGKHTMLLDGDNVRHGLNKDLGFKESDRIENIRRAAEVAKLMNDAGLIVITSFISPYIEDRKTARRIIGDACFIEVFVDTPLQVCEQRDVKGLYKKARSGEIPNFTGISSPYEAPIDCEVVIDTSNRSVEAAVDEIMTKIIVRIDN